MAAIARTSVLCLVNQTASKSIAPTALYGTNAVARKSETRPPTLVHPSEQFDRRPSRADSVSAPTNAEKRFVRNHGTSSFVDENARNLDFCFKKVRQYEFENFLCTLLLPERARRGAIAVRAFNIEIAQVRDSIKDRTIGEMRMQFWRDTVDAMYDSAKKIPKGNPIISELNNAVNEYQLSRAWLMRIIESRQEQLAEKPHPTLDSLEKYAESTVSSVNYLLLETLGIRDMRVDHAASHLGKAQGIVTTIRAIPFHAQKRRVLLPLDVLIKHGASAEDFIQGKQTGAVRDVTFDLACQAHAHLNAGRSMMDQVPTGARPALLASVPTHDFLSRLRKVNFDPFDSKMQARNQLLPMRLWWKSFRKSY